MLVKAIIGAVVGTGIGTAFGLVVGAELGAFVVLLEPDLVFAMGDVAAGATLGLMLGAVSGGIASFVVHRIASVPLPTWLGVVIGGGSGFFLGTLGGAISAEMGWAADPVQFGTLIGCLVGVPVWTGASIAGAIARQSLRRRQNADGTDRTKDFASFYRRRSRQ